MRKLKNENYVLKELRVLFRSLKRRLSFSIMMIKIVSFVISCSTNNEKLTIPEDKKNNYPEIKEISQLPKELNNHTFRITNNLEIESRYPIIKESMMVSYYDTPLRAIFTPLHHDVNSSDIMFHVYFELNGKVSSFDLLINEKKYCDKINRYAYKSIDGNPIVIFDVEPTKGKLINIQRFPNKNWKDRFSNCIDWTFDKMNRWDYLSCMAVGPVCAGVIASMCAIAANEGMFVQPDKP